MNILSFKKTFTPEYTICLLLIWQFFSLVFIILGIAPHELVWVNFAISVGYILFADSYYALLYIIASLPFAVALPLGTIDSIPMWRVQFLLLVAVFGIKEFLKKKFLAVHDWLENIPSWDRYIAIFAAVGLLTVSYAKFAVPGIKDVIFWINIYLIYALIVQIIKTKQQIIALIKFTALSLSIFVLIGYIQLIITFFTSLNIFWVYWATNVSSLYFGKALSDVLLYSNSWFSYTGGTDLRMFSVLPDSHSFAMVSVYCISFLLPLTYLCHDMRLFGNKLKYWLWSLIRFAGLAVVLSGTRAVWVGLVVPSILVGLAYYNHYILPVAKRIFWPLIIIIFFFVLSPLINIGLHHLRVNKFEENFVDRAKSIYDLNEGSNQGRLQIWKDSLQYSLAHPQGTGLANFVVSLTPETGISQDYQQVADSHNKRFNLPQKFVTAHNLYLHILVEMGVVGLVAFLLFWWKYFEVLEKFVQKTKDHDNFFNFFVISTAVTFIWFLAAAMFDVTFFNDKVLIYFFISLGLSAVIIRKYDDLIK